MPERVLASRTLGHCHLMILIARLCVTVFKEKQVNISHPEQKGKSHLKVTQSVQWLFF